ncbi:unnamed protein product [Ostreobium quekettii]|uniref:DNA sliding clamp PCNA n=1 Tax=Ostreobium quekettii TaxID=121088 RepID=A0A8S1J2P5_9CHLO|nr:unnamed protein product [Ostreobium quekettii]|eukprot:evm.model.scf_787.4 EVM.evm.TU.scf_787.4   scf_787:37006-39470(+)
MFEAKLIQGNLIKKIMEGLKDLVTEANFDLSPGGVSLQAMDSSHVALVALMLRGDAFENYRCDRPRSIGMNLVNLSKVLKCAGNDDTMTLKADDTQNNITLVFESQAEDKYAEVQMELMDIDSEHLGIPDNTYDAIVKMPSAQFSQIVKDLSSIGDTVTVSVTKDGITFSTSGDVGTAHITCKQNTSMEKEADHTTVNLEHPVTLTFALRYFVTFAKSTSLSHQMSISLSKELPVMVEYAMGDMGHIRFYLAPKIDDEESMDDS